jgi:hypothetical protein
MDEILKGTFFTDKLRTIITVILITLLMALIALSWAFPRESKVSQETLDTLKTVTVTLKDAAEKFEQQANLTSQLNDTLSQQLKQSETVSNENYNALLKQYGLDPTSGSIGDPLGVQSGNVGLRSPDNHLGGKHVSPGASAAGGAGQLQKPAEGHATASDSGDTGVQRSQPAGT